MPPLVTVRRATVDDAPELLDLVRRNREHLAPWDPERPPQWWTLQGQRSALATAARQLEEGRGFPGVIEVDGRIVGRVNLSNVVRGAFCSADLGYWVSHDMTGRGIATVAVKHALTLAFGPMELHRVQAGTLPHNVASQKVLERNGFERIGLARQYLKIAGHWADHILFQRLAE